ncbi:hypothetical protein BS47DRAFT_1367023 [Hydnum rufescens UP504]|uniref:DUF4100 domain-containing protein n=1 Tax=Hydnum rufescens UP504 TaxID=1448309 RepID=A0A9P6AJD2_9AGAM|nr:hypothetical protein BS47DRAFT_1367023 [Hydnum rufescens UP504]
MALEERKALLETDKYNYFWRGVKPVSFREEIGNNKKGQLKLENKQKKDDVTTPKPVELSRVRESVDPMKSNINDLAEKIGWLTLALGQLDPDKVAEEGHSLKDCPETKAFIAKKVLKLSNEGILVQLDGSDLPQGDINNRGVARILHDQLANASNVEMEHLCSFELLNQEFAMFEVQLKRNKPYTKDEPKGKRAEHLNKAYVEIPQRPIRQDQLSSTKPPTILKQESHTTDPAPVLPNEDVEMKDATTGKPETRKQLVLSMEKDLLLPKAKPKTRTMLDNIVVCRKDDHVKKRASPAYQFASELQERVDVDTLFNSLMDKEVMVWLGDVIGSSYELCKRLQIATKTQCVPVKPEAARSNNIEATISSIERNFRSLFLDSPSPQYTMIQDLPKLDHPSMQTHNLEPLNLEPGRKPKQLLINRPPKKLLDQQINAVAFELDDDKSEDNYGSDSEVNTNDLADEYYSGSKLNMMVLLTQAKLELPMDPSGKDWILCGVSGHQVNLVGLCRDVPIQVRGVPLPHNFFITLDNIGQKDIILGQPWLFSYSARIEYAHGEGMNLQVWQDSNCEGRSVHVTLTIMSALWNVFPIKATK